MVFNMKKIVYLFSIFSVCVLLAGCGSSSMENKEKQGKLQKSGTSEQIAQQEDKEKVQGKKTTATTDCHTPTVDGGMSKGSADPGFYSKDKEKIAAWLKKYPDQYDSEEDAYQNQVLLFGYCENKKGKEALDEFVTRWKACKKENISYQQALVVLQYTVEGDPIYSYLLNDSGTIYIYEDASRDAYGGGEYEWKTKEIHKKTYQEEGRKYTEYRFGKKDDSYSLTVR